MSSPTDSNLGQILAETRAPIEAALAEAQLELEELNARRGELEELISRAQTMLGALDTASPPAPASPTIGPTVRLTLHEAMRLVLAEHGNTWMTVHELADEINRRSLYEKRDHSLLDPSQIHARANKYPSMFEKEGPRVRLKSQ